MYVCMYVLICMCVCAHVAQYQGLKHSCVVVLRFLNADNEMKRIFGSRVVRAEGGGG